MVVDDAFFGDKELPDQALTKVPAGLAEKDAKSPEVCLLRRPNRDSLDT